MKVKVVKAFVDKNTLNYCATGEKLDISHERAKELIAGGYVEEVEEKTASSKKSGKSEEK